MARQAVIKGKDASKQSGVNRPTNAAAYWAMDYYFDTLKKAVSSAPSGGTEFGEKLKGYAEENIRATHDLIRQLSDARDFGLCFESRTGSSDRSSRLWVSRLKALARFTPSHLLILEGNDLEACI